ncbi:glycosyltransferase family 4 protein [Planctomycetota bacterium]
MNVNSKVVKICFVAPKAYPLFNPDVKGVFGGAEVDLFLLATELAKDDAFEVSFITADYGQDKFENIQGVRVIKSLALEKNPLSGTIKIWRAMKNADARIYFQETASEGTFLVGLFCRLHKRKFVYRTAHKNECDGTYLKKYFWVGKAFRWSLHQAAQNIVQNETDKENIHRTTGVDSIAIKNAHHLPILSDTQRDIVLWVGRSAEFKRPQLFLDLAEQITDEKFTFICPRATNDQNYEQLVARAEKIKNLNFIPHVDFAKIDDYFQRAKLFLCTSTGEGFPNTYVQACKNGAPILSLRVNPDNFLNENDCGICADGDWDRFVNEFTTLIKSERLQQLGKNARKYAEDKHDIKKIVQVYKKLFLNL